MDPSGARSRCERAGCLPAVSFCLHRERERERVRKKYEDVNGFRKRGPRKKTDTDKMTEVAK
jgi:hypothetical protein